MLKKGLCNDGSMCSYWDNSAWQVALKSQPDIVTIMLGTNDAKVFNWFDIQQGTGDFFALDYGRMIKQLRELKPTPRIFIIVPPPLFEPYPFQMNATIINEIFPTLVRDIADVHDCEVIDVHGALSMSGFTPSALTCDGCHPTDKANQIIAETIAPHIQKSIAKRRNPTLA